MSGFYERISFLMKDACNYNQVFLKKNKIKDGKWKCFCFRLVKLLITFKKRVRVIFYFFYIRLTTLIKFSAACLLLSLYYAIDSKYSAAALLRKLV